MASAPPVASVPAVSSELSSSDFETKIKPEKSFKGFSKTTAEAWSQFLDAQICYKEKMLQMCDNENMTVEELHALDPIGMDL